jgi:hypothetical protein
MGLGGFRFHRVRPFWCFGFAGVFIRPALRVPFAWRPGQFPRVFIPVVSSGADAGRRGSLPGYGRVACRTCPSEHPCGSAVGRGRLHEASAVVSAGQPKRERRACVVGALRAPPSSSLGLRRFCVRAPPWVNMCITGGAIASAFTRAQGNLPPVCRRSAPRRASRWSCAPQASVRRRRPKRLGFAAFWAGS